MWKWAAAFRRDPYIWRMERLEPYVASRDSSVALVPAILLPVVGDDLPVLRNFVFGEEAYESWSLDRDIWRAKVRAALELPPWPAL
jgi:hypothetical protein